MAIALTTYLDWRALLLGTRQAEQTRHILETTQRVLSAVKDAETGQRGYLLTGDDSYLEPYNTARATLTSMVGDLSVAAADKPEQASRVTQITFLSREEFAELAETIRIARAAGREAAVRARKNCARPIRRYSSRMRT